MKNKSLIITLLFVITIIVGTAGITFAYLSVSRVQSEANVLNTTCFDVSFTESNRINITSYPMSSTNAFNKLNPYNFTLTNKCAMNADYQVILNVINTTASEILPYIDYSFDGSTVNKLSSLTPITLPKGVTSSNVKSSYLINSGSLNGINATKNFNLHLWIDEIAGNGIMGKKFEAEIMVYKVAK